MYQRYWHTAVVAAAVPTVVAAVAAAVVANAIATNNFELVEKKICQQSLERKMSSLAC